MKKTIFILNIDNYEPEITKLTYPLIEHYAKKIQSEVVYITERKFINYPVVFEKFQIYELSKVYPSDWYIYIDSDVLIHPEFFDLTDYISKNEVLIDWNNVSSMRFRTDKYFLRDGRNIAVPNWFNIVSDWCLDFWNPFVDISLDEIYDNIFPLIREDHYDPKHRIDDYLVSRNVSKYGLKISTLHDVYRKIFGHTKLEYISHVTGDKQFKINFIKHKYSDWEIEKFFLKY